MDNHVIGRSVNHIMVLEIPYCEKSCFILFAYSSSCNYGNIFFFLCEKKKNLKQTHDDEELPIQDRIKPAFSRKNRQQESKSKPKEVT